MKLNSIEISFKEICKEDANYMEYFYIYMATKSILKRYYYPYIRDVNPFFTDHGEGHIERIFERLYPLLRPHLLTDDEPISPQSRKDINSDKMSEKINAYDLYLLMCSVLWHDTGNLYGRQGHESKIHKLFSNAKGFLYDEPSAGWIEKIGRAHSGENAIEQHIEREVLNMEGFTYHPKFLASLLRIADELDEDRRRTSNRIENLPENSKVYWFFCNCTDSIKVEPDSREEKKSKIVIEGRINKSDLFSKYMKDFEVTAIYEYIYRVDKINKELFFCGNYMKPFRFRPPDQLELRLSIVDGGKTIKLLEEIFNKTFGYNEFFQKHSSTLEAMR